MHSLSSWMIMGYDITEHLSLRPSIDQWIDLSIYIGPSIPSMPSIPYIPSILNLSIYQLCTCLYVCKTDQQCNVTIDLSFLRLGGMGSNCCNCSRISRGKLHTLTRINYPIDDIPHVQTNPSENKTNFGGEHISSINIIFLRGN